MQQDKFDGSRFADLEAERWKREREARRLDRLEAEVAELKKAVSALFNHEMPVVSGNAPDLTPNLKGILQ